MRFHRYFFGDSPSKSIFDASSDGIIADILQEKVIDDDTAELICAGVLKRTTNGGVGVVCPIFLAQDVPALRALTVDASEKMARKIILRKDALLTAVVGIDDKFAPERHLYHLLCGAVFDGCFFDRLAQVGALTYSKPQANGGDYLPILYEDAPELNELSAQILCSYNRLSGDSGTFASFGDANGDRRDLYRWIRSQKAGSPLDDQNVSINELAECFADVVDGKRIPEKFRRIFEFFDYLRAGRVCVPVYRKREMEKAVKELDELAAELVLDEMVKALSHISAFEKLTAVRLGVPEKDIANEIYHLLFGQLNEALVKAGVVTEPEYHPGEGRYLKCFECK